MAQFKRKGIFETFFQNRSSLIIQYTNGDITKKEFLEYNFDFVQEMNIKPFSRIDSFEKGMYNYQYYNVLAKYYTMLAKEDQESIVNIILITKTWVMSIITKRIEQPYNY